MINNSFSSRAISVAFLIIAVTLALLAGRSFQAMHEPKSIYPGSGITDEFDLHRYNKNLKGTPGDTSVYVLEGEKPGGTALIVGGTHPDEPAGFLTTVVLLENLKVEKGTLLIIPRANKSGFTHNSPLKGYPQYFRFTSKGKEREFRFGSRLSNPVHQWPDPTVSINPAGLKLAGFGARNLNRCYPGDKDGSLTEKVAWAIMELIRERDVDVAIDLHESSPEYPVTKALVAHPNSLDLASMAKFSIMSQGVDLKLERSPASLGGLSHREWGDHTSTKAFLIESPNPIQGRMRGRTDVSLLKEGRDKFYRQAADEGSLFVEFGSEGWPIEKRIGIHTSTIRAIIEAYSNINPSNSFSLEGIPSYEEVSREGVSAYLRYSTSA
ncbi:succinylglutamate desuccinylase/aspartoacylase family protein [Candidatus Bipolaricaulota bacterium]|nr:succinylglutamate desuccinylase/aspartoacylase family protein [Candidatus Bipolaricaulota bacterium]